MRRFMIRSALILGVALALGCDAAQARPVGGAHPVRSFHIPTYKGQQLAQGQSRLINPAGPVSLNPQPLPPRTSISSNKLNWGMLNPQPLPPRVGGAMGQ